MPGSVSSALEMGSHPSEGPESGVWSAPDVDRARALIRDAHAAGQEVTVWVTDFSPVFPGSIETGRYVVEVLNELGLRAHLKVADFHEFFHAVYVDGGIQAYVGGWATTYSGAGGFIDDDFRCGRPDDASGLCTKEFASQIAEAQRLQATDPAAANQAWIEIEHQLVEQAEWAPLINPVSTYAISERTENVQVHPQWGILMSRLWVQ